MRIVNLYDSLDRGPQSAVVPGRLCETDLSCFACLLVWVCKDTFETVDHPNPCEAMESCGLCTSGY